jgi:hypothetical protein
MLNRWIAQSWDYASAISGRQACTIRNNALHESDHNARADCGRYPTRVIFRRVID